MPQSLTDIRNLLAAFGLHPKKRFGQNFLHDGNQLARIIDAAALAPGDIVLEVGPGTGVLTEALLDAGAHVLAAEADRDLEPLLQQRLAPYGDQVELIIGDALAGKRALSDDVTQAIERQLQSKRDAGESDPRFKLVANLPYNAASPLLGTLAADWHTLSLAIVMVQREVADRLAAPSGGKTFGPLTVIVQAAFHVSRIAVLSPGCFWPQPQVESAVVRLERRASPLHDDFTALGAAMHQIFSRRRKQLGAILGRSHPLPPGIDGVMRPEQLTVEQHCDLARLMAAQG